MGLAIGSRLIQGERRKRRKAPDGQIISWCKVAAARGNERRCETSDTGHGWPPRRAVKIAIIRRPELYNLVGREASLRSAFTTVLRAKTGQISANVDSNAGGSLWGTSCYRVRPQVSIDWAPPRARICSTEHEDLLCRSDVG